MQEIQDEKRIESILRQEIDILPRLKPWDSLTSSGSIIQSYRLNYSHCVQDLC